MIVCRICGKECSNRAVADHDNFSTKYVSSCCSAEIEYKAPEGGASVEPDKDLESFRDQIAFEYMKSELRLTDPRGLVMKPEALKEAETRRKERIAKESYQMADIMLEERSNPPLDITTSDGNPPLKP